MAHLPKLFTPAEPVLTTAKAKEHLRVDFDDDDDLIESLVQAATIHVERKANVALGQQTWQQDFDQFSQRLRLPVGPVVSISSVTYRNTTGQINTVSNANYGLFSDELGAFVRFEDAFSLPSDLWQFGAVRATWVAGHEKVPEPLVAAVKLVLGDLYADREAKVVSGLVENPTITSLIATYKRF